VNPKTLAKLYRFQTINSETAVYGITGFPLKATFSPLIHNTGFAKHGMNAVYIPLKAETIEEALSFADATDMKGLSVTVPHKETVMPYLQSETKSALQIGACNTIVRKSEGWTGYDTDAEGLVRALKEFLVLENLSGVKVAIIGAGGAAKAAAFAVKQLKGDACIFNRSFAKAKLLADKYEFKSATLGPEAVPLLLQYNALIIQTTPVGMNAAPTDKEHDPLLFYYFNGSEAVFDVIYTPPMTPLLARAQKAGCRTENGRKLLDYQAYEQFKLFTGETYETIHTG
jgi:3-dehydroquinate dehydratase/shikimate dehydrogenase